jgi:squalene-hopene/tetraprenyl-beta-curcumene cyclase
MHKRIRSGHILLLLVLCLASATTWKVVRAKRTFGSSSTEYAATWNARAAERYLDSREVWWQKWPSAQMDHGTVCVSCHTVLPYALVQPDLRREIGAKSPQAPEEAMLDSVEKRVADWSQTSPYYTDAADGPGKSQESRATEAVLNAVILSSYDAVQGRLSPLTRAAFEDAWVLQEKTGANAGGWRWQDFHLAPWESSESAYQGAALMAIAIGKVSGNYASQGDVQVNLELLKQYLRKQYSAQPLINKLYVLWASARLPDLLTQDEQRKLVEDVAQLQLNDGGWALSSLDEQSSKQRYLDEWKRLTHTGASDGCATGLVILALEISRSEQDERVLQRGLEWLQKHQLKDGSWFASSLNGSKDYYSDEGLFMSDAATGYAVLALENARERHPNGIAVISRTRVDLSRP